VWRPPDWPESVQYRPRQPLRLWPTLSGHQGDSRPSFHVVDAAKAPGYRGNLTATSQSQNDMSTMDLPTSLASSTPGTPIPSSCASMRALVGSHIHPLTPVWRIVHAQLLRNHKAIRTDGRRRWRRFDVIGTVIPLSPRNGRTFKVYNTWHPDRDAMSSGYCGWLEGNKQNYASLTWLGSRCPFWFWVRPKEAKADAKLGCRFLISESNQNFVATAPNVLLLVIKERSFVRLSGVYSGDSLK
jgi:hypothetical protein